MSKAFAAPVLREVSVGFAAGEIHALLGMNGAGKSTLVRILAGALRADGGEVWADGARREFRSPGDALAAGVAMVYQELDLAPHLTVGENLLLGAEPARAGLLRRREERERARRLLEECGLALAPERRAGVLRTGERQLAAIAKAYGRARVALILDEPTSALNAAEVETLFDLLRRLRDRGLALIYISHRLDEIERICDRVTVLRNGRVELRAETRPGGGGPRLDREALARAMVGGAGAGAGATGAAEAKAADGDDAKGGGRRGSAAGGRRDAADAGAPPALELIGGGRTGQFAEVSLALRAGEALALAGLAGDGRGAVGEALFGLAPLERGEIRVRGTPARIREPRRAVELGLGFIPDDRARALCPHLSSRDNVTLAAAPRFLSWWRRRAGEERRLAEECFAAGAVAPEYAARQARRLSGGTQQKLLFARWLATDAAVLILNEPTRGVDVSARAEIHRQILARLRAGAAVLLISSDLEEILQLARRALVFRGERAARELAGKELTREAIVLASAGGAA